MTPLTFHILLSLKDESRDAEGIVGRMRELTGANEPPLASFYRSLKKALDDGTIVLAEPTEESRRGRPPQRYRITRAGRAALSAEARRIERLAQIALSGREPR
ncbi:MAG TPA: hypothetical protein VLK65_12015 [Vicinamibacteria bacterium]|nr:hypothetical protein [Vicinamibacteria bacterium]